MKRHGIPMIPGNQMGVMVKDRLPCGFSIELRDRHSVGIEGGTNRMGHAPGRRRRGDHRGLIDFEDIHGVSLGDHEGMPPGGREEVEKDERELILVDLFARRGAPNDVAEDAFSQACLQQRFQSERRPPNQNIDLPI